MVKYLYHFLLSKLVIFIQAIDVVIWNSGYKVKYILNSFWEVHCLICFCYLIVDDFVTLPKNVKLGTSHLLEKDDARDQPPLMLGTCHFIEGRIYSQEDKITWFLCTIYWYLDLILSGKLEEKEKMLRFSIEVCHYPCSYKYVLDLVFLSLPGRAAATKYLLACWEVQGLKTSLFPCPFFSLYSVCRLLYCHHSITSFLFFPPTFIFLLTFVWG